MGRSNKRNQTLPPAPVVVHIAPAPVVSPEGIFFAPGQRQWMSTSRPLQPCMLRQHLWRSTSRPLLPCTRHKRLVWSTSCPLQPCTRHKRPLWYKLCQHQLNSSSACGRAHCASSCRAHCARTCSPDASDASAPEDVCTSCWVSLPVPIETCTTKVSAEAVGQACETPTVMHGRGLPAVSRDRGVGFAQWLRKEAARRGYAWRQQRRAQQLCL